MAKKKATQDKDKSKGKKVKESTEVGQKAAKS